MFINSPGGPHAEIMLINSNERPKKIYITNSPCQNCSNALRQHFAYSSSKPTILVGRIWHLNNEEDDEGLRQLLREGFNIEVWDELHERMYPNDSLTRNYIQKLKSSILGYCIQEGRF